MITPARHGVRNRTAESVDSGKSADLNRCVLIDVRSAEERLTLGRIPASSRSVAVVIRRRPRDIAQSRFRIGQARRFG
jgi:hypothetical protein